MVIIKNGIGLCVFIHMPIFGRIEAIIKDKMSPTGKNKFLKVKIVRELILLGAYIRKVWR